MGLAIASLPSQVGGALGVAVLGSVLSSSYASHIAGSLHGAARNVAAGAGDSVGSTMTALASGRFGPWAVTVLEAARTALVQAMGSAVTIAVGVALLGALTALIFLPTRPVEVEAGMRRAETGGRRAGAGADRRAPVMGARPASSEAPAPAAELEAAGRKAVDAGAAVRLEQGVVTRLAELGIAGDYDLLVDLGCYHLVPAGRRDAYVRSVTWAAAPGTPPADARDGPLGAPGGRRGGPATAVRRVGDHPGARILEGSVLEAVPDR